MNAPVAIGTAAAVAGLALAVDNLRRLRVPAAKPPPVTDRVAVLLPVRDEVQRVGPCLRALLTALDAWPRPAGSPGCPAGVELIVLDDCSTDGTAQVVRRLTAGRSDVRMLAGTPTPAGWLGKPWACAQLAAAAGPGSGVLVFVDADVVLEPHGLAATAALLRESGLDLVCPYPRQIAITAAERLVQPLLQWSWFTTLPLGLAERSPRESLAAANGQLLAVDAAAYARAGGHGAVRDRVLDDLALLRAIKRAGGRGVVADGTTVASCRMYDGWAAVRDGYGKSLWAAFGSPGRAAAVVAALGLVYVVPAAAALRGSRVGLVGYVAAVAGRVLVARRTGGRALPDSLAHPVSVLAFAALTARSCWRHRRGGLRWKGRPVVTTPGAR